jgi:hypothetical protein
MQEIRLGAKELEHLSGKRLVFQIPMVEVNFGTGLSIQKISDSLNSQLGPKFSRSTFDFPCGASGGCEHLAYGFSDHGTIILCELATLTRSLGLPRIQRQSLARFRKIELSDLP